MEKTRVLVTVKTYLTLSAKLGETHGRYSEVYYTLDVLIQRAKANERSLAVFRPTDVLDLVVEADERERDEAPCGDARAHESARPLRRQHAAGDETIIRRVHALHGETLNP